MGICEVLTIIFVVLKLINVIEWSWWLVLLPEIIAFSLYGIMIVIYLVANWRLNKSYKEFRKKWYR